MFDFLSMTKNAGGKQADVGASPLSSASPSNFNVQTPQQSSDKPFNMVTFIAGLKQRIESYQDMMGGMGITGTSTPPQLNMQIPQIQSVNFANPQQNQQVLQQYFSKRGR